MTIFRPWTVGPGWAGEDVFIICGGTSVQPKEVNRLRGRPKSKVMVVNRSYIAFPWADILFFADDRWWVEEHVQKRGPDLKAFEGLIVTTARHTKDDLLWHLKRIVPTDLVPFAVERTTVALETTSVTGAINLAIHKGAKRIILVGADNKHGPDGRVHYHQEYPWDRTEESWWAKNREMERSAKGLMKLGIEVVNASPGSALTCWPIVNLGEWLNAQG